MKTKLWIAVFAVLLVVCLGASFFLLTPGEGSTHAEILSDGKVLHTVDLRIDRTIIVCPEEGRHNTVSIENGKIAVIDASCPDHYCMKRGYCSGGTDIVCLPNRLVIRFLGEQVVDAAVG